MKSKFNVMSRRDIVRLKRCARKDLIIISAFFLLTISGLAQTTPISFQQIPFSDPDIISPFRGGEQWHDDYPQNVIGNPTESSTPPVTYDAYSRSGIAWWQIETSQGVYNWTAFDARINDAINKRRKFSFNIMSIHPGSKEGPSANGVYMSYPLYLHNQMQAEDANNRDWITPMTNHWVPNYNSPNFKSRVTALLNAIANHINTTSYNGVAYKNVIGYIDIGILGSWGEWNHSMVINSAADYPAGRQPTGSSMIHIIDAYLAAFPNFPLVIPHAAYDGNRLGNTMVPPEVGYRALTATNNWGKIGWKRMNWGWTYDYINYSLEKNPTVYNGVRFDTATANRWKYALICGEGPCGGTVQGGPHPFWDVPRQVKLYHASMIGNGNWCGEEDADIRGRDSLRMAFKLSGYRLILESGSMTTNLLSGAQFSINLNWKNVGVAPVYEKWNVTYELRNSAGTAVWTGNSSFSPTLFLPQSNATPIQDNFTLPSSIPSGNYSLVLVIRDPNNYRYPLPLAIRGRSTDGSYPLRAVTVGTGTVVNGAPVASAGANVAITLPVNSVNLNGSASRDADGTIASYAWSQVGGPGTASFTNHDMANAAVGNLTEGVYTFRLAVTDNQGASATDDIQVTVNPLVAVAPPVTPPVSPTPPAANVLPVANAGSNQTISLPMNSATIDASASTDADGTIAKYVWLQESGPTTATIANNTSARTLVSNLVEGVYSFQLTVTDNAGGMHTAKVSITVKPLAAVAPPVAPTPPAANVLPVANAGSNQTITLPVNSATINASASTDADGTISKYVWLQESGPTTATIANNTSAQTVVSNLVEGVYSFQLTVTDNAGGMHTAKVSVTVQPQVLAPTPPAANILPVARAGSNQTITLPVNSATINASASTDADGTISKYVWLQESGPTTATIANNTSAQTVVSNLVEGVYSFQLTVTDNAGGMHTAKTLVTVNPAAVVAPPVAPPVTQPAPPAANVLPVARAGANQTIILPANSATIDASASTDADGTLVNFAWLQESGPSKATIANNNTAKTLVSNLIEGVYYFQLTVTDNSGGMHTAKMSVTVQPQVLAPTPPTVNTLPVARAGGNQTITLPVNSVTIDAGASTDADGTIVNFVWLQESGPSKATIANNNTAKTLVSSLIEGVYYFQLTVTDNAGGMHTAKMSVSVNPAAATPTPPAANVLPIAKAGDDISFNLPKNNTTLDGRASSDPDGNIVSWNWTKVSGPREYTLANPNTSEALLSGMKSGTYVFELTVTDNRGGISKDRVGITVIRTNASPMAKSADTIVVNTGAQNTLLNAEQSYDPDGIITNYTWSYVNGPKAPKMFHPDSSKTVIAELVPGMYEFGLTVTDDGGAKSSKNVVVHVTHGGTRVMIPKLSVYPNPVVSDVNISIDSEARGRTLLTIYDMNLRPVMTDVFNKDSDKYIRKLNLSRLAKGMYTVVIQVEQTEKVSKLIVKH